MLIFKKAHDGTLEVEGLRTIANVCDVTQEGVKGAKSFFEAKVKEQTRDAKFEQEIKGNYPQNGSDVFLYVQSMNIQLLIEIFAT